MSVSSSHRVIWSSTKSGNRHRDSVPKFQRKIASAAFNNFSLLKLSKILWDQEKVLQPQGLFILLNFQRFAANKGMVEVCKVTEGQGKDWKKTKASCTIGTAGQL